VRGRRPIPAVALALLLVLVAPAGRAFAQAGGQEQDPVAVLLARLEQVLRGGAPQGYLDLLAPSADRAAASGFAQMMVTPGATRVVVRERDRGALQGSLPGDGYALLVEVFTETGARARVATWRLDVRRRVTDPAGGWGIVSQQMLTTLAGLYRLALNPRRQVAVKDLVVSAEDLTITVPDGTMFLVDSDQGPTGAVILGRGEMAFAPDPPAERSQLRVVTGNDTLQTTLDAVFLRVNPSAFDSRIKAREMVERPVVDPREFKRADDNFRADVGKSFSLELGDLSPDTWSLIPGGIDMIAEIRTRRFDILTYARSASEIEDISLFDRKKGRNLSVYASRANLARYTPFYSEDEKADYAVGSYDLDVRFDPGRQRLEGIARLAIEVREPWINTFTLKLAESLNVRGIVSPELGRLLCVRVRNQSSVVVNLPATLVQGFRFNVEILYDGSIEPQTIDRESISLEPAQEQEFEEFEVPLEESYLFSNRSFWYPQAEVLGYATADIRVTLDEPWSAVASGQFVSATLAPGPVDRGVRRREFTFAVRQPVRYLALLVGRLAEVKREKLTVENVEIDLRVMAHPRQRGRSRDLSKGIANILKFYTSLIGDFPYSGLSVTAIERKLPGGHSPAYMVVLAVQGPVSALRWTDDPGALPFPEFFLSHELAHQWWGQAVGWKNYHEQWLSEGFAQYFSALYAERIRGRATFDTIIRRMSGWAIDDSDQGPIFLGYRVGHFKGDSRLFRAVVYNKGAMVLHMLRGLVGDEAFFAGIRRFYATWRFKKAGTDDFRRAMEEASGRDLTQYFAQWVLGDGLPQVTVGWRVEEGDGGSVAVVRLEQTGEVFQLPVTVTVEYEDGSLTSAVVKLTEKTAEARIPATRKVRRVDVNRDRAAVGVFRAAGSS
jgi:hypothetical protein